MSVYAGPGFETTPGTIPFEWGSGPVVCAEDCIASCRSARGGYLGLVPIYPGDPDAYGRCLNDCQQTCPGGAPDYQPGLCESDLACRWGLAGELIVTAQETAQAAGRGIVQAVTPGSLVNLLLLGGAALVAVALVRR